MAHLEQHPTLRQTLARTSLFSVLDALPSSIESFWLLDNRVASLWETTEVRPASPFSTVALLPRTNHFQQSAYHSVSLHESIAQYVKEHFRSCRRLSIATPIEHSTWDWMQRLQDWYSHHPVLQPSLHPVSQDWCSWCYEWMFLGVARSPGVVFVGLEENLPISRFEEVIKTALLRKFQVVLFGIKELETHIRRRFSTRFHKLAFQMGLPLFHVEAARALQPTLVQDSWIFLAEHSLAPTVEEQLKTRWKQVLESQEIRYTLDLQPLGKPFQPTGSLPVVLPSSRGQIEIDWAEERDLQGVMDCWEALMDEHARWDSHFRRHPEARQNLYQSLRLQLHQPDGCLLVARTPRSVVGFLSAHVVRSPLFEESRTGHLLDLYVSEEVRRHGLGRQLVKECLSWFQTQSVQRVELNVACLNPVGQRFWDEMDFAPYLQVLSKRIPNPFSVSLHPQEH